MVPRARPTLLLSRLGSDCVKCRSCMQLCSSCPCIVVIAVVPFPPVPLLPVMPVLLQTGNPEVVADLYAPDGVLLPTVSNQVSSRGQPGCTNTHKCQTGIVSWTELRWHSVTMSGYKPRLSCPGGLAFDSHDAWCVD